MSQTLKDTLKNLNKNLEGLNKFSILSELPDDSLTIKYYSTNSPYLDYKLHGGIPKGRMTLITGWESSGKSSLAALSSKAVQGEGKYVVYFDGEQALNDTYLDRFDLSRDLLIHRKESNLEAMLDAAEEFSKTTEVGMIIVDSITSFYSSVIEDKSAEDNSIGVEAKKYNARMPIIHANCSRMGISLIMINQWRENPGKIMGDPRVLSRGHWQKYMPDLHLDFTKKGLLVDDSGVIGNEIDIRIKKSKMFSYDGTKPFPVNFYYAYGFNKYDEYAALFVEKNIVEKSGAWFKLPDGEKLQGLAKVSQFLSDNPEYLEELKKLI